MASRDYDPYGAVTASTGTGANLGFQGSWTDPSTGRVNAQARWYTPGTGTFASADTAAVPFTDATSTNLYGYGGANPTSHWDPSGHFLGILDDVDQAFRDIWDSNRLDDVFRGVGDFVDGAVDDVGRAAKGVNWGGALRVGAGWAARLGLRAVPVVGTVIAVADAVGLLYYIVNQDGSLSRVERPTGNSSVRPGGSTTATDTAVRRAPDAARPEARPPKPATPPTPPAPYITGTKTTNSTNAWSTQSSWWDDTYLYNRTDDYTFTTHYLWTYWSDGSWNSRISGTSWTHHYQITAQLLIDLSNPITSPSVDPVDPGAPLTPESASPSGVCGGGGSIVDCLGLQRGGTVPPDTFDNAGSCTAVVGFQCTGGGHLLDPATGEVYCNPTGTGVGVCTPMEDRAGGAQATSASRGSCVDNSFTPDTPVLMADGTRKAIADVEVGDRVLATDPATGRTEAETVTDLIVGEGVKHLVDLVVDTDGEAGGETATLTATDNHPFWVENTKRWTDADDLNPGDTLTTADGTTVTVASLTWYSATLRVHNLTVSDLHTYYVLADETPVLVHNSNCSLDLDFASESGAWIDPSDQRGQYTLAGRALQKHAGRNGNPNGWPTPSGRQNPQAWNATGQDVLDEILTHPGAVETRGRGRIGGQWQGVIDIRLPNGLGARFGTDGRFSGFLD
ncbi:RHS repeat-associated protein [Allostreptomyces psammosilenae]|uniref:RHS repeat-associated protein n=1 Tax=Allostreptomyces psammosilenae TaxID=1892865 RepID=A0A852ZZ30_9ACTN|nr:RHS repeat-associated protein [Allostreptomyces psammosilenae]